jgi:hypothetical protein
MGSNDQGQRQVLAAVETDLGGAIYRHVGSFGHRRWADHWGLQDSS